MNVYVEVPSEAVLIEAGDHVPFIPLVELEGRAGATEFRQSGPIWVNEGVAPGLTLIVSVAVEAHCPPAGENVYVVVAVLSRAGAQDPLIPLFEVVGSGESGSPEQIGATGSNVGTVLAVTVTVIVAATAHCPPSGVKL